MLTELSGLTSISEFELILVHGRGAIRIAHYDVIDPSLIEIGSKTAEKNSAQTNNEQTDRQTNRHYENNGHLAVNQQPVYLSQNLSLGLLHSFHLRTV